MIEIRQAVYEDIPRIMNFIDEHWKKGHILARDRSFFEWQFVDGDKVNVFLGVDPDSGKIYGMQGIIRYSGSPTPDTSGSIWKTIKSSNPKLGVDIGAYSDRVLGIRYSIGAGLSERAIKLGRLMGRNPIAMDHYYRLGDYEDYKIAVIKDKSIPKVEDSGYRLYPVSTVKEMEQVISGEVLAGYLMSKDYAYIQRRYFEHPVYHYDIWKILDPGGKAHSILITREEEQYDRKICKIIDYYGEMKFLARITSALDQMIKEKGYEFVDVYSHGVDTALYEQAGFLRCNENSKNIIPNYFHPFEQKNIVLKLLDPKVEGLRLFRGDGDQDRPS